MAKKPPQANHWADQVVAAILAWQKNQRITKLHVDDMKTPSGRVHTGALEGVIYHDFLAKILSEKTNNAITSTYVFNDMDPMDGLPNYLDQTMYTEHMGKPLFQIPAPSLQESGIDMGSATEEELADFRSAKSFAEVYAFDFMHAFRKLGCDQKIVWSHELYQSGKMDETVRLVLDNVESLKRIYREVAEYELPKNWYPFQVICPQCGKVGTTLTTDWDGKEVTFECQTDKVEWATGCGHAGNISPFGGNGKLLWKVDWPSHWKVMGVTVEGAGKDHTSAGGSRDMANAICAEVLQIPAPFDMPYEWILIRGAKMSSSKGVGTSAREFTELFPPEIGRFLFANKHYNQVLDFDPTQDAIPDLFDLYDQGARIFWGEETGDTRLGRSFELAHNGKTPDTHFLPRFRDLAKWMQHPEMDLLEEFTKVKGSSLTETEQAFLADRKKYAEIWIERYAPDEYQLRASETLPKAASELSSAQLQFLKEVEVWLQKKTWEPAELQQTLFDSAKQSLGVRQGFQAIYLAYLGKKAGPRAAWFLLSLEPAFRQHRMQQLAGLEVGNRVQNETTITDLENHNLFTISPGYAKAYPDTTVGIAIIKGITIDKSNPELEASKARLLDELQGLTTQQLGEYPEIQSYRKMYRSMGIDWHSRRPSPEALLRRLAQGKELYSINTCVDAYNMIVMKNRVSVGAFDLDNVQFPTTLDVAKGGEKILLLGDSEPTTLKPGEVCYFDQQGPYNLDFNYRDAQRTMVQNTTTNLLINVEGVYDISREQVEQSLTEVIKVITKYCGGTVKTVGISTC